MKQRARPPLHLVCERNYMRAGLTSLLREVVMTRPNFRWLLLSIAALGCGGSQASAPAASTANEVKEANDTPSAGPINAVSKHGSGTVSATFGKGGGTLELDEGPRVVVPAGEIDTATDFVLK